MYIYSFYNKYYYKPTFQAGIITSMLLLFNIYEVKFLIYGLHTIPLEQITVGEKSLPSPFQYHAHVFFSLAPIFTINYFIVYHKDKYIDKFSIISHSSTFIIHRDFYIFWLYFFITLTPVVWMVVDKLSSMP